MKRKILLPTDFSKNAWHAIVYAIELYKNTTCDFYILNVFSGTSSIMDTLINMEPGSQLFETAKLESENGLAKVLDMITMRDEVNPKHTFKVVSKFNHPLEAIKNLVEEKDIEMIVMGTKGETNTKAGVFGSVAIGVMEKVRNCPVIVVPELAKRNIPKEIVFPTSLKTHFKRRELYYLIELVKNCDASLKILHIGNEDSLDENQKQNKRLLEEYMGDIDYAFHFLSPRDILTSINCFVESRDSDMVAFINKKHKFFGSLLSHPLVKELGYSSKVPMLVLHDLRN
jgi:nucleotide-binding universal stress UspA family protein